MLYDTLVISGASSSGVVLLGKLARLEYDNVLDLAHVETYAGTSIGAVISLLLIIGYTPNEIVCWLRDSLVWDRLATLDIMRIIKLRGIFSMQLLEDELSAMVRQKCGTVPTFGDLHKNLLCVSFNMNTNKLVYFTNRDTPHMNVVRATVLSCAIPFLFEPCYHDGDKYIDGGIIDNFPLLKTIDMYKPKCLLGVLCCKHVITTASDSWQLSDLTSVLFACSTSHTRQQIDRATEMTKVNIVTVTSTIPFYDLYLSREKIDMMYRMGYSYDNSENVKNF